MSTLPPQLNDPGVKALYLQWVTHFLSNLDNWPPSTPFEPLPESPEAAMPRTPEELKAILDAGLRATFDSWRDMPALRNGDIRLEIRHDTLRQVKTTSQGYWIVDVACARTGLQSYLDNQMPNGRRVEFRSLKEITDPASLISWIHAPVTIYHPRQGMVTIERDKDEDGKSLKHGYVFAGPRVETMPDGEQYLVFSIVLDTLEIVEKVRRRELVEVSAGYECLFVYAPGIYKGQSYDGLQTAIRINHLAFLPAGFARAGQYACVLLDSQDSEFVFIQYFDQEGAPPMGDIKPQGSAPTKTVRQVRLDSNGTVVDLNPSDATLVEQALNAKDQTIQQLTTDKQALTTEKNELKGRVDGFAIEKKAFEDKITQLEAKTPPNLKDVLSTLQKAAPFLGEDFKIDSLDTVDVPSVQLAALKQALPNENFDSPDFKEPIYIKGVFDSLCKTAPVKKQTAKVGSGNPSAQGQILFDSLQQQVQGNGQQQEQGQNSQEPKSNTYYDSLERETQERILNKKGA